jgi:hypothetical protein
MTIDERIQALFQSLQAMSLKRRAEEKRMKELAVEHRDFKCCTTEYAAEHRDFERRMTDYAADVKDAIRRLANIAGAHGDTLDDHAHRLDNLES